jgi:hypothetical protein
MKDEETGEGWLEHWIVVGNVSEKAIEAIELVNGHVDRLFSHSMYHDYSAFAVCFLYDDPPDDDVGFVYKHDGKALQIDVYSSDEHIALYLYSIYPNPDRDVSDVTGLHLVTEGEWFEIVDGNEAKAKIESEK